VSGRIENGLDARTFILGGNATVTLASERTGARFTYAVKAPTKPTENGGLVIDHSNDAPRFVKVLTGSDNEADYQFLGTIFPDGRFVHGRKSRIGLGAPSAKAFAWSWQHLNVGRVPEGLQVWHEGRCGRCGRKLTVPSSIASGFGPECINHV